MKVYGEGEWKVRKHGWSKRRTWRKLHLAVNEKTQEIEAEVLTDNATDDRIRYGCGTWVSGKCRLMGVE